MDKPSYIKENGIVDDINKTVSEFITGGNMILMYTDRFVCREQREISDTEHLLEARVFNDTSEIKVMRPTMADNFYYRFIDDTVLDKNDYIEENHYLDINENLSSGNNYVTTGGGHYSLPVADAERITIRNYISFSEQGIAQITDFRVVKFLRKGEV